MNGDTAAPAAPADKPAEQPAPLTEADIRAALARLDSIEATLKEQGEAHKALLARIFGQ